MKKQYFKIMVSAVFVLSVYGGVAQTDQPILERYSSSPKQKTIEESSVQPELSRSSVVATINKNSSDSLERLNTPELKRYESSPVRKEQPKNSK
jgi:hypothetical protein